MKKWHWRDLLCFLKLKFSRNGYVVQEMCGRCNKCNIGDSESHPSACSARTFRNGRGE